ncbi:VanZ family protein [uncultured Winogradskyella sp.]|uniref:VanZ family protein n=1 Tax=uncultured Winogradskyella sp. TaxID=395353 RepID=UPI0026209329|nr:VanZ family protein [uncultured Winogradskyella sp.]
MVKKLLLTASIGYTIVLIIVSLVNLNSVPSLGSSFDDKIYHCIAYLVLAFLWMTYFKPSSKKYIRVIVFTCVILFGIILELIQHILNPNRTYDNYDLMANCIGVLLGTLIAIRLHIITLK